MANIKLKATLRAYAKTPFYNDFVRDIFSQEDTTASTQYVRVFTQSLDAEGNIKNVGEWIPLDTALLEKPLEDFQQQVILLKQGVNTISVRVDEKSNQLVFVDSTGKTYYSYLPQSKTDGKTIKVNDLYNLYVVDTPDNETLKITDIIYKNGVDNNGVPIPDPDTGIISKVSGKIRVEGIYVNTISAILSGDDIYSRLTRAESNIKDLEDSAKGLSGALTPVNLGFLYRLNANDEGYNVNQALLRDAKLNEYAYTQLNNDGSNTPIAIPDQTKIQNLYDGIVWVYVEASNTWINEGADVVVQANNDGVLGVVTGSLKDFEGKINPDGTISINGLEDEFSKVIYENSSSINPDNNSIVRRSTTGQIKAENPIEDNDVATLEYLKLFYASNKITDEQIESLFGGNN